MSLCVYYGSGVSEDDGDEFTRLSKKSGISSYSESISLCEVHLGCTFEQILKAKNHILEGGLLSLLVFPKENSTPRDMYIQKFDGKKKCGLLSPVG